MLKKTFIAVALVCASVSASATDDLSKLMAKAGNQDNVAAQIQLGNLYASGGNESLGQSYDNAAYWFTEAANNGSPVAQFNLAVLHEKGVGVEQSYQQAAHWYQQAATKGHAGAQLNLGYLFEKGLGVKTSPSDAYRWYKASAQNGDPVAQHNLGLMLVSERFGMPDHKTAFSWFLKSAELGYAPAMYSVALRYLNGTGIKYSANNALAWLTRGAGQDNLPAQILLAELYSNEKHVKADKELALRYTQKAASAGHTESQLNLARHYLEKSSQNYQAALPLLISATNNNNKIAKRQLTNIVSQWDIVSLENLGELKLMTDIKKDVADLKSATLYKAPAESTFSDFVVMLSPSAALFNEVIKVSTADLRASAKPEPTSSTTAKNRSKPSQSNPWQPGEYSLTRGPINLRAGAGTSFDVVGQVSADAVVELHRYAGHGWAAVRHPDTGETVFMMSRVLKAVKDTDKELGSNHDKVANNG